MIVCLRKEIHQDIMNMCFPAQGLINYDFIEVRFFPLLRSLIFNKFLTSLEIAPQAQHSINIFVKHLLPGALKS